MILNNSNSLGLGKTHMMVCLCHPFSDKKVREHLSCKSGSSSVSDTYGACSGGNKPKCCTCLETVKDMVKAHNRTVISAT